MEANTFPDTRSTPANITGLMEHIARINRNRFKFKSLSDWALNLTSGCSHGCHFCYVAPLQRFQKATLSEHGIHDPAGEWGNYQLLRTWNEDEFRKSLRAAERTPKENLSVDGNRAVMLSTTTDAYAVIKGQNAEKTRLANERLAANVRRALEMILEESTLNVRILTRSPLACRDFDLMRRFGDRLLFGMSLPTLNNKWARVYEPSAPAPTQRLKTLQEAKRAGLHVFVAVAPTYPQCDEADLRATLSAVAQLKPVTVFHEPINVRGDNAFKIAESARQAGVEFNLGTFRSTRDWASYAISQLRSVEKIAHEVDLGAQLHLWPDQELLKKPVTDGQPDPDGFRAWVQRWHGRVSEWPRQN